MTVVWAGYQPGPIADILKTEHICSMLAAFTLSSDAGLLLSVAAAIVGLVVLIARFKLNSFIALMLASVFVGVCAGMPLPSIATAFQQGVAGILGSIAIVIGLGTILGKMLAESGGAEQIANRLIGWLGRNRLPWALMLIGFIVGLPVFFSVGLVLLVPILFTLARQTEAPLLLLGIPLLAGLSVAHGLVPPHPGPMAAIGLLNADVGKTIFYAIVVGFPVAILAGPILGRIVARRLPARASGELARQLSRAEGRREPSFGWTLLTILLPVGLMLLASLVQFLWPEMRTLGAVMQFLGDPAIALLLAVLLSFYTFGVACGFGRDTISKFSAECLGPVALVLLVVGAGGGFNKVLVASGAGEAIARLAESARVSPIILGWLVAASIRIATGSATVSVTAAAGVMATMVATSGDVNVELLVIAMGAGSLILSHVNDGGFWLVKEYLNLSVTETLLSWTVMETVISVAALAAVLLLDWLI